MTDGSERRGVRSAVGGFLRRKLVRSLVTGVCIGLMVNLCLLPMLERPAVAQVVGTVSAGVGVGDAGSLGRGSDAMIDWGLIEEVVATLQPGEDAAEVVVAGFGEAAFGALAPEVARALRGMDESFELIFARDRRANEATMFVELGLMTVGAVGELHAGEGESVPVSVRAWTARLDVGSMGGLDELSAMADVRLVTLETSTVEGEGILVGLVLPWLDGEGLVGELVPMGVLPMPRGDDGGPGRGWGMGMRRGVGAGRAMRGRDLVGRRSRHGVAARRRIRRSRRVRVRMRRRSGIHCCRWGVMRGRWL